MDASRSGKHMEAIAVRAPCDLLLAGFLAIGLSACAPPCGESEVGSTGRPVSTASGYIVVLQPGASAREMAGMLAASHSVTVRHIYGHALNGFSFRGSDAAAAAMAANPNVRYVELDQRADAIGKPPSAGGGGHGGGSDSPRPAQVIPWGIQRVGGPVDATGRTAWVIDTGVDVDHPDLNVDNARSVNFAAASHKRKSKPWNDGHGHGTHVAGIIAAKDDGYDVVGVAAGAAVVAVRVLNNDGYGSYSDVIAGVDWVAANGARGDVANMSLGGPPSEALDSAVANAANTVTFVVAAGNDADLADNYSPARVEQSNVYTVSAIDTRDNFAWFSNYGNPPVDYAAPGLSVLSTWLGGDLATLRGTSMAAPHVAGILLLGAVQTGGHAIGDADDNPDPIAHR